MTGLSKNSILVVEGKQYEVSLVLESLVYLDAKAFLGFFNKIGLTLPRQLRIQALKEVLEEPVKKTIEERKTLADELSYRLSFFNEYGESQLENLLSFYSDKKIDRAYLENFYLGLLKYMINKGVAEASFTEFFRLARAIARKDGQRIPEAYQFNKDINSLFFDREGRIDGLSPVKFRPVLYKGATLVELREVGAKYGVNVPRRLKKEELCKIIVDELKERGDYTDELGNELKKMPVISLQRYAKDNDIKASTELKKEEVIEYILENAKETKEQYFEPAGQSAYEVIVEEEEEEVVEYVDTMTVINQAEDDELIYIEIISKPNKLDYLTNERLNLDGLEVMAFYRSGYRKTLRNTEYSVSETSTLGTGEVPVTITYEDKIAEFNISVADTAPVMLNIEVVSRPDKVNYLLGEELILDGLLVYSTYSNGMQRQIDLDKLVLEGFDSSKVGTSAVVVRYQGFISRFEVEIVAERPQVVGIELISVPLKTVYLPAEDFNITGLTVDALYENGDRVEIDIDDLKIEGFENGGVGDYDIIVKYEGFEVEFKVLVKEAGPEVVGLVIDKLPEKLEYFSYEALDLTGIEANAILSTGDMERIDQDELEVFGFDTTAVGKIQLTVLYEGHSAYFDVLMKESDLEVNEIVIKSLPHKFSYSPYEALDTEGLEVEAIYQGDKRVVLDNERLIFTNFDSSVLGPQMVTIDYEGKSAYFEVQVAGELLEPALEVEEEIIEDVEPVSDEEVQEEIKEEPVKHAHTYATVDNSEVVNELRELRKAVENLTKIVILNSGTPVIVKQEPPKVEVIVERPKEEKKEESNDNPTPLAEDQMEEIDQVEGEVVEDIEDAPKKKKKKSGVAIFFITLLITIAVVIVALLVYVGITVGFDMELNELDNALNNIRLGEKGLIDHLREFFRMIFQKQ